MPINPPPETPRMLEESPQVSKRMRTDQRAGTRRRHPLEHLMLLPKSPTLATSKMCPEKRRKRRRKMRRPQS
jgi:hypothetical protein